MRLVIGGSFQGKKKWVMQHMHISGNEMADGAICTKEELLGAKCIDHFHVLVKHWLESGEEAWTNMEEILAKNPKVIVISDEIGNGIIPLDPVERQYREVHGRLCCYLAKEAEEVVRVYCGMGQRLFPDEK